MRCINNIATNKKVVKIYGGHYFLYKYNINDTIEELIIKYKANNNLTLNDISDKVGYSTSYICNVINKTIEPSNKLIEIILDLTLRTYV